MGYCFKKHDLKGENRGVFFSYFVREKHLTSFLTATTKRFGNACSKKWILKLVGN